MAKAKKLDTTSLKNKTPFELIQLRDAYVSLSYRTSKKDVEKQEKIKKNISIIDKLLVAKGMNIKPLKQEQKTVKVG